MIVKAENELLVVFKQNITPDKAVSFLSNRKIKSFSYLGTFGENVYCCVSNMEYSSIGALWKELEEDARVEAVYEFGRVERQRV